MQLLIIVRMLLLHAAIALARQILCAQFLRAQSDILPGKRVFGRERNIFEQHYRLAHLHRIGRDKNIKF